jgi:chemosensory pili system protein ChpA (sensor histidine kinase/response regulator)
MTIVATENAPDFDLGPLSWVQGEIDQALGRGLDSLAAFQANPGDATELKHARTHVHQAAGAIQMVGLDAVVAYTDEIERQLGRLEELPEAELKASCAAIDHACRKLRIFLAELVGGSPPVPLRLFPEYEKMQRARGVKAAAPTDLFFPDLAPRAPKLSAPQVVPAAKLPSYMVKQRRQYQRGLLAWLRGDEDGAKTMRDAIAAIEDATTHQNLRAFWWTTGALFDALNERGLEGGFGVKQLAARIDLQIRRVVEGSAKVADRLRREVLYYVAIAAPVAPSVQAVQKGFKLGGLIPSAEVLNSDLVRIQPLLRDARDQLAAAKDSWLKFTSGRAENLPKLKQTLTSVHKCAAEIGNGALMKLTAGLVERLDKMPASSISEPLAMEYATGLLLAESAADGYANLGPEFPKQVEAMLSRIDAARASRPAPAGTAAPMLDEMSKRAQERLLLAQVGREIQANLRHMEQVLDAFFRDNGKRAELGALARDSTQIRGALTMLGLDDAERLLGLCQEQIAAYADPETPVNNEELELLAESLSGLGFYIEAVEQQRPDRDRLIAPLLARRLGETPAPVVDDPGESVEDGVEALRATLPGLVDEMRPAPADPSAREALKTRLTGLRDDAELIGDAELVVQAASALKELDAGGAALAAAVDAIAESQAAPAPSISEETQRLLATEQLDGELLEIYLAEAAEVIDAIGENHATLRGNPGDREALRNVRRAFHTLKGSGRMVGLTELGDIAYDVEKLHNRLLDEDRPVTTAVLSLIAQARDDFRHWVDGLSTQGRVHADPAALHAAIRAVEDELPPGRESVLTPTPPAPSEDSGATAVAAIDAAEPAHAHPEPSAAPPADEALPAIEIEVPPVQEAPSPAPDSRAFELPELGSGGAAPNVLPLLEVPDFPELEDGGAVVAADAPSAAPTLFAPAPDEVPAQLETAPDATAEALASDDISVGGVVLSASLFEILVAEADQHLATLRHETQLLQFDPAHPVSQEMVRASHTLCGIHRTGGFPLVAVTSKALEQTLLGLQQHAGPPPSAAQPVLQRAVAGLGSFVARIKERVAFSALDADEASSIQNELEALRADLAAAVDDAETLAARHADEDDEPSGQAVAGAPQGGPDAVDEQGESTERVSAVAAPAVDSAPEFVLPAAPASSALRVDPLADVRDDVDADVLPIFLEEAAELLPQAGAQVRAWRRSPQEHTASQQLRRTLHTFKGSARMAGAMRLGELTHLMESRILVGDDTVAATPELFEALDTDLDQIAWVLDALREGRTNVELPWVVEARAAALAADAGPFPAPERTEVAAVDAAAVSPVDTLSADEPAAAEAVLPPDLAPLEPAMPASTTAAAGLPDAGFIAPAGGEPPVVVPLAGAAAPAVRAEVAADAEAGARAMLRVRADMIDRLVNEAGEVAIARSRVEGELRSLKSNLLELTGSVIRLRAQVREIEIQAESQIQSRMSLVGEAEGFDPLEFDRYTRFQELTRSLAEGVNDVSTVQQSLLKNLDDADAALLAQARMSREVQQQLFSIRTVPFGSLSERLYRILRRVAQELGKRANLEIRGGQTELDRSVLEKLVGPLEHLLRNALDHGVEPRDERLRAGKTETGEITLTVRQVGNEIAIELADDGSGIDLENVRRKAVAQGRIAADAQPTDAQLIEFIFHPGFSTASRVTQISGLGVGMDVVRSEIATLGGRVEVASTRGKGTTFMLYLPLTLAVAQAVLVRAGGRLWALPAPMVEQVQQVKAETLVSLYVAREVDWQGRKYPFHYLPRLLGDTSHNPETQRYNPVLLLRTGQGLAAVHVDEMIGNQEVVVKNIGPQLARVSGIAGATVLGNGEIVLIINPVQLAARTDVPAFDPNAEERIAAHMPQFAQPSKSGPPLVMVVDDSLTVRKITSRMLTREGFTVITAKDGMDALQMLGEQTPDVILLDIEMPRMDGFEFTKTIKNDPKSSHIPIIMITSRTAEKHRNRAQELGVDLYLGKPYQEEELLRHLREMLEIAA